jgi:hypothetical protein
MSPRLLCNVVYAVHVTVLDPAMREAFDAVLDEPVGVEAAAERALLTSLAG